MSLLRLGEYMPMPEPFDGGKMKIRLVHLQCLKQVVITIALTSSYGLNISGACEFQSIDFDAEPPQEIDRRKRTSFYVRDQVAVRPHGKLERMLLRVVLDRHLPTVNDLLHRGVKEGGTVNTQVMITAAHDGDNIHLQIGLQGAHEKGLQYYCGTQRQLDDAFGVPGEMF